MIKYNMKLYNNNNNNMVMERTVLTRCSIEAIPPPHVRQTLAPRHPCVCLWDAVRAHVSVDKISLYRTENRASFLLADFGKRGVLK